MAVRERVAVFNEAYLGVAERTGPDFGGRGLDDRDAAPLGVRCAERYLSAVETATAGGRRSAGARCSRTVAIPAYARCSSR
ncbi:DUF5995 family protein [Streptomyces anulatus]|uniref:DUF5995 family protein n=1 Tax=Streptomyces anulatus TaxID=1892 RepID=UPI00386A4DC0